METLNLQEKKNLYTRESLEVLKSKNQTLSHLAVFKEILLNLPFLTLVLNRNRQTLFWGRDLEEALKILHLTPLGNRPGEILRCIHSHETAYGCGTSESCGLCGIFQSTRTSLEKNQREIAETRMTVQGPEGIQSLDFRVTSIPLTVEKEVYLLLTFEDVSSEKKRRSLENIFFHDVLNTAGGIKGLLELLAEDPHPETFLKKILPSLCRETEHLVDEILSQRELAEAENNELQVRMEIVEARGLLEHLVGKYAFQADSHKKKLVFDHAENSNMWVETDPVLLRRVLGNMIKNALEASAAGDTIRAGVSSDNHSYRLWVQNPQVIAWEVQSQIFQRSFSTKGPSRGLGTYSIKILTEKYLKGRASFYSEAPRGTTFWVDIEKASLP